MSDEELNEIWDALDNGEALPGWEIKETDLLDFVAYKEQTWVRASNVGMGVPPGPWRPVE